MTTDIHSKSWSNKTLPKKILVIRLQAMGDVVITLPYIQHLKKELGDAVQIDFLTRKEVDSIPRNIILFHKVYSIKGKRNVKLQCLWALLLLPKLLLNNYDVVIDLQNNIISRYVTKMIRPKAWSHFDRFSMNAAGQRTQKTIEAVGLGQNKIDASFKLNQSIKIDTILISNGWDGKSELVILNPAGLFSTRNWPLQNYVNWAKLWLAKKPNTQFVVLGIDRVKEKAIFFKDQLENNIIDLVNKTSAVEAFAILQNVKFILTEDGGLMHMAWVSGVPTLALFGSTNGVWSRPLGEKSLLLDSSDLECGACMLEFCKYSDNHCLTRYTAEFVFEKTELLLSKS